MRLCLEVSGGGQTETGDDPRAALQKDRLKFRTRPNRRVFLAPKETAPARGKLGPQLQVGVPEGYRHNSDVVSKFADPIKFCFSVCVSVGRQPPPCRTTLVGALHALFLVIPQGRQNGPPQG